MRFLMVSEDKTYGVIETEEGEDVQQIGTYTFGRLKQTLGLIEHLRGFYADEVDVGFVEYKDGSRMLMLKPKGAHPNAWIAIGPVVSDEEE